MHTNTHQLRSKTYTPKTLAVDINGNGKRVNIELNSIRQDSFMLHHGVASNGNTVNSLHSTSIGKSVILRAGKTGPSIAATNDEMEVFATQFLQNKGFNITPPNENWINQC